MTNFRKSGNKLLERKHTEEPLLIDDGRENCNFFDYVYFPVCFTHMGAMLLEPEKGLGSPGVKVQKFAGIRIKESKHSVKLLNL